MSSQNVIFLNSPNGFSSLFSNFELFIALITFLAVFCFWLSPGGLAWALSKAKTRSKSAIPGPSGLPLLGLVFSFTTGLTHRVLAQFAQSFKASSLMAFSVGLTRFVISSQPDSAKEILNSSAFADRPIKESAYGLLFDRAMGFAPYGEYWRNLRRISVTHLFGPKRVAHFGEFRKEIGSEMVCEIKNLMFKNGAVEVRKVVHFGSLNNVMKTVFDKKYKFGKNGDGVELESLVTEGYELLGIFNWSDHFPVLGCLDLQGVRKRCKDLVAKVNVFVGKIIQEHRVKRGEGIEVGVDEGCGDFVDVLLDLEKDHKLTDSDMIAVLWEMIFRGTDTVAILLEWILARMVLHPEIQAKAQSEIDRVVGKNRTISDSDLQNLPYLNAIVKETLRVHPPGPLLSWARLAIHDTHVGEHFIPAGTTAMVNMWAITHSDEIWSEPGVFRPERFLEEDVAIMGTDLRLAPFGAGRRVCPGKAMGLATVQLWLAQLLQSFNWYNAVEGRGVDLSECLKLSMEMEKPLVCKAVARV
ncbi:Cytochrome P450, family 78, subfamily A, polypeptide 10 [Heracleum sosnowskyi]|uniref:Cytochrome P450, family 78, subfamily A, polypeptide 10 n=1 Tax=Heracleum sosnowskyi TaxID=360622 RepID=A0AAD8HU54_9APIA|nr:Cytochrome P450, family 78, subfamily A, polypeptide 10 [Heracleum sosnowskyi]